MADVHLSARTGTRRIDQIAEDTETQLLARINESPRNTIQVDETTDDFVRCVFQNDVHQDMFTSPVEPFNSLNDFISGKLNGAFCVGVRTDGAAATSGRLSDFSTRVKEVASECESAHRVVR